MTLVGCGSKNDQPEPGAETGELNTVVGTVRVAGSTPFEQVLIEPEGMTRAGVEVRGAYREELIRLSGAEVRATGTYSATRLIVSDYEILEIAGHKPVVGILELTEGGPYVRTSGGKMVGIIGAPEELLGQQGGKVWVILDSSGVVKGYGVIRERR